MAAIANNPELNAPKNEEQGNQKDDAKSKNKKQVRINNNKNRKTMEKGFLDVALLTTNIGHLKSLMKKQDPDSKYPKHPLYIWVMAGLITSICLQVSNVFIMLF